MTARQMWNIARRNNQLPPEWGTWAEFRAWVNANRYKAEYGYKGEFSPQGCLKAMPEHAEKPVVITKENVAALFNIPPEILDNTSGEYVNYLTINFSFASLKKHAEEMGLDTKGLKSKREIANLITGGDQIGQNR